MLEAEMFPLHERCQIHADKMWNEGHYTTSGVLSQAGDMLFNTLRPPRMMDSEVGLPGHEGRKGYYAHIFSGSKFFPCDPRPEEVSIIDIAHHLAMQCRFNGGTKLFYSVAEHSWLCSYWGPKETALERLLHDAAEAYLGDMIRPLKRLPELGDVFLELETRVERAIANRFQLTYPFPVDVWQADEALVTAELANLINNPHKGHLHDSSVMADCQFECWAPEDAKAAFLKRFFDLAAERGLEVQ